MKNTVIIILGAVLLLFSSCKDQPRDTDCVDRSKIDKNRACYKIYAPVCGCDNVTYGNDCEAKKNGVTRYTKGECKKQDNRIEGNCNDIVPKNEACQAYFQRWFYNKNRNQCEMIGYSGCSQKGFATQQDCEKCMNNRK